jgi:hypothetical protein
MSSVLDTDEMRQKIAGRIDPNRTALVKVEARRASGLAFADMAQVMDFAKTMAIADIAIRKHLRGNVGACLAVTIQAIEWEMSPFAVANKSYEVNGVIAYEAQLINAVILSRAPIIGRFKISYEGAGDQRVCTVALAMRDGGPDAVYESPLFGRITPKNSPLWKSDPDQQQFYYSSRALCRRHFPDVLLGVYAVEEVIDAGPGGFDEPPGGPKPPRERVKDLGDRIDRVVSGSTIEHEDIVDPETGEITDYVAISSEGRLNGVPDKAKPAGDGEANEPAAEPAGSEAVADSHREPAEGAESASPQAHDSAPAAHDVDKEMAELIETGWARAHGGSKPLRDFLDKLSLRERNAIGREMQDAGIKAAKAVKA